MSDFNPLSFTGTQLDRADYLRGKTAELDAHKSASKNCVLWRGKPLIDLATNELVFLSHDHPVLQLAKEAPIFLGIEQRIHHYAWDISSWVPDDLNEEQMQLFLDESQNQHPSFPANQVFADLRAVMTLLDAQSAELAATAKAVFSWHRSHQYCSTCGQMSEPAKSGWQRNCTVCSTPHFPRTDPVVIMLVVNGNETLLGRSHGWPEKMYSCLAGFVEPGETLEAAVCREVKEETNIDVSNVKYVASQPWPFPSSLMIGCICAAQNKEIKIDPEELDDARWINKETLMKAISGIKEEVAPARKGSIASFLIRNWLNGHLNI